MYTPPPKWLKIIFIFILFIAFDYVLNYTLYNPQFITPLYAFALHYHVIPTETSGYPLIHVKTINEGLYDGPRATIIGTVTDVLKSGDGDWHMNVQNSGGTIVAEIIPEYPLPVPQIGDKIKIWGITRYDIAHRWWELHPVIGWQKL